MYRYLLILASLTWIQCFIESWMHSVTYFDSEKNKTESPELYIQETLYDSVMKYVVLSGTLTFKIRFFIKQDGSRVSCRIPLDPTFTLQTLTKQASQQILSYNVPINITQALQVLFPLKDLCAYHFTRDFIWEFCFKKYVRQFDDIETVKNLRKNAYEDFKIGISSSYNRITNESIGVYTPTWGSYQLDSIYHQAMKNRSVIQLTDNDPDYDDGLAVGDGYVVRLFNYSKKLLDNKAYNLEIVITEYEQLHHQNRDAYFKMVKEFKSELRGYTLTIPVYCIIHSQLILLKTPLPNKTVTHRFRLIPIHKPFLQLNKTKAYFHHHLIFGVRLNSQRHFYPGLTLAISVYNTIYVSKVKNILDTSLIEMENEVNLHKLILITYKFFPWILTERLFEIQIIILDTANHNFDLFPLKVVIQDNIMFCDYQYRSMVGSLIEENDIILTFNTSSLAIQYPQEYRVSKIYLDGLIALDKQFTNQLLYEGQVLVAKPIGSYKQTFEHHHKHEDNSYLYSSIHFNKNYFKEFFQLKNIIFIEEQTYISQEAIKANYQFKVYSNENYNDIYAFSFKLNKIKKSKHYALQLRLKLNSTKYHDIEFIYSSDPSHCIYVRQYDTKGVFQKMDPRFLNNTLLEQNYWVVIELNEGFVSLGKGEQINQANLLLRYQLQTIKEGKTTHKLKEEFVQEEQEIDNETPRDSSELVSDTFLQVDILQSESFGLQMSHITHLPLSNFKSRKLPWRLEGPLFTPLNFSAFPLLQKREEEESSEQRPVFQYNELLSQGTFCPAINETRSIDIRISCKKNTLLEIIKVNEPRICRYKMEVGTYLLCDPDDISKDENNGPLQGQRIMCTKD